MSRKIWSRAIAAAGLLLLLSPVAPASAQEDGVSAESSGGAELTTQAVNAEVNGSGATFIQNIMQAWTSEFKKREPRATVAYSGVGSSAGRRNFCDGVTDFGASDTPFPAKADEDACMAKRAFVYLPITAGGVSAFYNLAGSPAVKLSGPTLAKIFSGKITNWNDADITADNGTALPSLKIEVVVRQEGSGTSNVFTSYMKAAGGGSWTPNGADTFPQAADIPGKNADYVQVRATGSSNVAQAVKDKPGRIGYAEVSFAKNAGLPSASVKNGSGAFVQPTGNAVSEAIGDGTIKADGTVTINFLTANPPAYPISTVSYVLAPTSINNKDKFDTLKAFLTYANGDGQAEAIPNDYAPTPPKLRENNTVQIAKINSSAATQTTALQTGTVDSTPAAAPATTAAPAAAPATTVAPRATTATTVRPTVAAAGASRSSAPAAPGAMAATGGEHALIAVLGFGLLLVGFLGQRRLRTTS